MKVGVHGKSFSSEESNLIESILKELSDVSDEIVVSNRFSKRLRNRDIPLEFASFEPNDNIKDLDFMFSLGGDGTLLDTLVYVRENEIPILGINTGRLGYLATTAKEDISEAFQAIKESRFSIDERALLHLESSQDIFNGQSFALNDFTVLKKDSSSMIGVDIFVNDEFLNKYWSDGLIVATPTGSTGYSLSCGGPLVLPHSNNFIITPVAPHNLTVRPLVLADSKKISFKIDSRSKKVLISLDSRSITVDSGIEISVSRENFVAKLVKIDGYSNFDTLRQKLNWGLDNRN